MSEDNKYGLKNIVLPTGLSVPTLVTGDGRTGFHEVSSVDGTVGVCISYGERYGLNTIHNHNQLRTLEEVKPHFQILFEREESIDSLIYILTLAKENLIKNRKEDKITTSTKDVWYDDLCAASLELTLWQLASYSDRTVTKVISGTEQLDCLLECFETLDYKVINKTQVDENYLDITLFKENEVSVLVSKGPEEIHIQLIRENKSCDKVLRR